MNDFTEKDHRMAKEFDDMKARMEKLEASDGQMRNYSTVLQQGPPQAMGHKNTNGDSHAFGHQGWPQPGEIGTTQQRYQRPLLANPSTTTQETFWHSECDDRRKWDETISSTTAATTTTAVSTTQ